MARTFTYSDNLSARVEVLSDPDWYSIACVGHGATEDDPTEIGFRTFEDACEGAAIHADRCDRCADDACRTPRPHDAGHRCRKP